MIITGKYPKLRLRRSRIEDWSRRLVRENTLSGSDFVLPIFLTEGKNKKNETFRDKAMNKINKSPFCSIIDTTPSMTPPGIAADAIFNIAPLKGNLSVKVKLGITAGGGSAGDFAFIFPTLAFEQTLLVIKNGGEINNYIGDAILAIFGLNETRQQTLRATNAALEMINRMDEFKKYLIKAYGSDFDIRIGIHYGEVIVGSVGYGEDKKLTVIGDAVNIASRIEAINKDAGTRLLVSDDAYNEIRDNVDVQNFLRLKLRGTSNLITLHEIQRVKENSLIDHDNIKEISHDNNIWTRTLPISELEEGEKKKFISKEKEILLIKQEGIYAIENFCPHMNLPLDVGQITESGTILCPYHNLSLIHI